ncbi:MAG: ankyrin repeat domain-containing protein [Acetobacteraceae bacterium]|nr:ankyrin repeat domain-containing protein [Acetobacteraceae bacterium]
MLDEGGFLSAVRDGEAATVRDCLEADPSLATLKFDDGASTIGMAARLGRLEVLRILLDCGAVAPAEEDPENAPTSLMEAAASGEAEAAALLLQRGANPSLRDPEGRTAADYAQENGHPALAQRLRPDTRLEPSPR